MKVISKNGYDYLETYIAKIDNNTIDASVYFIDIIEAYNKIFAKYKEKDNSIVKIPKYSYGNHLHSILKKFSGNYLSPSMVNSFLENPALAVFKTVADRTQTTTIHRDIGDHFHKILETFYSCSPKYRTYNKLVDLVKKYDKSNNVQLLQLCDDYYNLYDYIDKYKKLDHKNIKCECEYTYKDNLRVKSLNAELPCKISGVIDRIDFRDDLAYIIDYKTGKLNSKSSTFDGYLTQMILYKWIVEDKFDIEVDSGYLISPKSIPKHQIKKMDYTLENEKILLDKINDLHTQFISNRQSGIYEFTNKGYWFDDIVKQLYFTMKDCSIWNAKMPVNVLIGKSAERI